jgi:hypothetical protein
MFTLRWTLNANETYQKLRQKAQASLQGRQTQRRKKSSRDEGLFKQVHKCVELLRENPRHPGLHTHEFDSIENPYHRDQKVFEAYAQNRTPGAYRVFWCHGPQSGEITILAITPHP